MFKKLEVGATIYHIPGDSIVATTITKIDSNDKGIYIFAKAENGEKYRFILINYLTGKIHFGKCVFVRVAYYMETA